MTRQRSQILEEVRSNRNHPTADQIYEGVRRKMPNISMATVYRNLEILAEQGLIQKLETQGKSRRYDYNTFRHYHVRCIGCDEVGDVLFHPLDGIESKLEDASGYEILGHSLEFIGVCPRCRDKKPTATGSKGKNQSTNDPTN
jgi:Fe2+ or Zn2+ uptake regulation protein